MNGPQTNSQRFVSVVIESIHDVAPHLEPVAESTSLIGVNAILDSVGFISLLVAIEQRLEGRVDLATDFLEHGTTIDDSNPFCTVATLAHHLDRLHGA